MQIKIDFNDRYAQANTYHHLGMVAQEQRQWKEAEQYFQQALQIKIEYNDRYTQANTYIGLGVVAQEQRQWKEAREYFLKALETYVSYKDDHNSGMALYNLARLWQASGDADLPGAIASIMGTTSGEVEVLLRKMLEDEDAGDS